MVDLPPVAIAEKSLTARKSGDALLWALLALVIFGAVVPWVLLLLPRTLEESSLPYQLLILTGALVLAFREIRHLGELRPGSSRVVARCSVGCCGLLAISAICFSAWLASVTGLLFLWVCAYAFGGFRLAAHLWPAWLMLALGISLPFDYAELYNRELRGLTLRMSTEILDYFLVPHLPLRNVVEVGDTLIRIDRAFQGLLSLPVIQAIGLLLVAWNGASLIRVLLVLVAAIFWAVIVNNAWEVIVIWLYSSHKLNLNSGWSARLLVVVLLFVALGLIVSTNALIRLIALPFQGTRYKLVHAYWEWRVARIQMSRLDSGQEPLYDDELPPPPLDPNQQEPRTRDPAQQTKFPALARTGLVSWPIMIGFGCLAIVQAFWFWPCIHRQFSPSAVSAFQSRELLVEDMLPAQYRQMERVGFTPVQRYRYRTRSQYGKIWNYRTDAGLVVVSVDYPVFEWQEVGEWFYQQGWWIERRAVVDRGEMGPLLETYLSCAPAKYTYSVNRQFDSEGREFEIPDTLERLGLSTWFKELTGSASDHGAGGQRLSWYQRNIRGFLGGFQVQIQLESNRRLTGDEIEDVRSLLDEVCGRIRSSLRQGMNEGVQ